MSSRRSRAREAVLQVLYQHDLNPDLTDDIVLDQLRERLAHPELTRSIAACSTGRPGSMDRLAMWPPTGHCDGWR
jgi:transcription termination factor NusB